MRRLRLPCLLAVLVGGVACSSPVYAAAAIKWSGPAFLNAGMAEVGTGLDGVTCQSEEECVAVDSHGREVTFDPARPQNWSAQTIDGARPLTGVSCPTASQCTAVDGGGVEITFNPGSIGGATRYDIDPGQSIRAVSCPSSLLCAAVDARGEAFVFAPADPSSFRMVALGETALSSIACASTSQCTALDSGRSAAGATLSAPALTTFDPQSLRVVSVLAVPAAVDLDQLACPATGECVAVGLACSSNAACQELPSTVTFDPASTGTASVVARSAVGYFDAIACASGSLCTAMDADGTEVTFDPNAPGELSQAAVDPIGDWPKGSNGAQIACPSMTRCVLATGDEPAEITFVPLAAGKPAPVAIDDGAPIAAVACPAPTECVELADAQPPYYPGPAGLAAVLNPGDQRHVSAVEAPIVGAPEGLACPARTQCTAVMTETGAEGHGATAVTFDPYRPRRSPYPESGTEIDTTAVGGVDCPTATQCTAVDDRGREVTFDPTRPSVHSIHGLGGGGLASVGCPSSAQCTAVGSQGREVTFDPLSGAIVAQRRIDRGRRLMSLACPTTQRCSAVDQIGRELTFSPLIQSNVASRRPSHTALTAIACSSQDLCVAVNVAGQAILGDPQAGHRWVVTPIPGAAALLAVACLRHADAPRSTQTVRRSPSATPAGVAAELSRPRSAWPPRAGS